MLSSLNHIFQTLVSTYFIPSNGFKNVLLLAGSCLILSSCFKEEIAMQKPSMNSAVNTVSIPMTANYDKQFYFDLFTNNTVSQNNNEIWDLAFDASENGFRIWLNSSKKMQVYNTGIKNFESVNSTSNAKWLCDYPTGEVAHNAIGEWGVWNNSMMISNGDVYIIDRGLNHNETSIGMKKVVFLGLENGVYKLRFAKMNGDDEHVIEIPKNDQYNRVYLSLNDGGSIVDVEPKKEQYDLIFSRYTHIFFEENNLFYLVTGTLSNINGVMVAIDSSKAFSDITMSDVQSLSFSNHTDAIGYNWKSFDLDNTKYEVLPNRNYIIKDVEGNFYKLRFIDFFNEQGERGYPKFEYQLL